MFIDTVKPIEISSSAPKAKMIISLLLLVYIRRPVAVSELKFTSDIVTKPSVDLVCNRDVLFMVVAALRMTYLHVICEDKSSHHTPTHDLVARNRYFSLRQHSVSLVNRIMRTPSKAAVNMQNQVIELSLGAIFILSVLKKNLTRPRILSLICCFWRRNAFKKPTKNWKGKVVEFMCLHLIFSYGVKPFYILYFQITLVTRLRRLLFTWSNVLFTIILTVRSYKPLILATLTDTC